MYECVWYWDKSILFYCIDDGIFMGPDSRAINKAIEEVERAGLEIEYRGNMEDYLGVNVKEQNKWKYQANTTSNN